MIVAGFDWDAGNWPKCGKRGVSREEIESLFAGAPAVETDPAHSMGEPRLRAIGRAAGGRHVFVAFTIRLRDGEAFIRPIQRAIHAPQGDRPL